MLDNNEFKVETIYGTRMNTVSSTGPEVLDPTLAGPEVLTGPEIKEYSFLKKHVSLIKSTVKDKLSRYNLNLISFRKNSVIATDGHMLTMIENETGYQGFMNVEDTKTSGTYQIKDGHVISDSHRIGTVLEGPEVLYPNVSMLFPIEKTTHDYLRLAIDFDILKKFVESVPTSKREAKQIVMDIPLDLDKKTNCVKDGIILTANTRHDGIIGHGVIMPIRIESNSTGIFETYRLLNDLSKTDSDRQLIDYLSDYIAKDPDRIEKDLRIPQDLFEEVRTLALDKFQAKEKIAS